MGRPKQLVPWRGTTLLRHAAQTALDAGVGPVLVMLGAESAACEAALAGLPVEPCMHNEWRRGIGSTVAAAAAAAAILPVQALVVMACDQPLVSPGHLAALRDAWRRDRRPMAALHYDGVLGIPALFARGMFAELMLLDGDQGAGRLLRQRPGDVSAVPGPEGALDVDTESDVQRLSDGS